ncbi:MAG: LTA synthase family protein [Ruminococcaceae bacterium]|nr:LTA synthase family protein [Oscillospiraceae bacterium]
MALTAALLLCAAVCLSFVSLALGSLYVALPRILTYFSYPGLILLNTLPVMVLLALLYLLFDRAWLSFLLTSVLILVPTGVNYYKVVLRDDPFVFEDLAYAGEAAGIIGQYDIHLTVYFKAAIAACFLGTLLLFLFARAGIGLRKKRWLLRLGAIVLLIVLSIGGYRQFYADDELYESFENYTYFNRWQPVEDYASRGFVYPFLHSIADAYPAPPAGYSDEKAEQLLAENDDIPAAQKVNVITIMLESFCDLTKHAELKLTEDPYAILHELQGESLHGTMISDTMGGGTSNSERSFLTGTVYPQPDYRHASWSYVQYFRSQGYATEGAHPGFDWYYNRKNVNLNLGFDHYYFNENFFDARTSDEHAADDVFFTSLLELYHNRDETRPYFNFSISYQGHGPYSDTALSSGTEYISSEGLSEACYYTVNNYLGSVADTLAQLKAFLDVLRQDAAPAVVLLFGDHKPTLGNANSCYDELGIDISRTTDESFLNYYATDYFIWANDAAEAALGKTIEGEGPTVGPYFLMNVLFDACGWEGPGLLKITDELLNWVDTIHSTGAFLKNGVRFPFYEHALSDFYIAQHYLRKHAYK